MALPVVIVASGGIPVTEIAAGGPGLPVVSASIGLPITIVASGGLPVIGSGGGGGGGGGGELMWTVPLITSAS
jgi:hypothetical protein